MELSTAPSSRTMVAFTPKDSRLCCTKPGYAVAIRLPEMSLIFQSFPIGAANRKVELPKSKESTSSAGAAESISKSRPVIPASSSPDPT